MKYSLKYIPFLKIHTVSTSCLQVSHLRILSTAYWKQHPQLGTHGCRGPLFTPFCIRDLSISRFWSPQGALGRIPTGYQGATVITDACESVKLCVVEWKLDWTSEPDDVFLALLWARRMTLGWSRNLSRSLPHLQVRGLNWKHFYGNLQF